MAELPTLADLLQGRELRNPPTTPPLLLGPEPPPSIPSGPRKVAPPWAEMNASRPTLGDHARNGLLGIGMNPHSANAVAGLMPWTPFGAAHQGGQDIAEGLGTGNWGQMGLGTAALAALPFGAAPRAGRVIFTREMGERAKLRLGEGLPLARIADEVGVDRSVLRRYMSEEGLQTLPRTGNRRRADFPQLPPVEDLLRLHQEGSTLPELASRHGVSEDTIRRRLQGTDSYQPRAYVRRALDPQE